MQKKVYVFIPEGTSARDEAIIAHIVKEGLKTVDEGLTDLNDFGDFDDWEAELVFKFNRTEEK